MLVSHYRRFIYLKTLKTAGTSVEILFQPQCEPSGAPTPSHETEAKISGAGIVGARKPGASSETWYNHMPAARVRELIGPDIWSSYLKFCVIRNPYDKVVSWWWHQMTPSERARRSAEAFPSVRLAFNEWAVLAPLPLDRDKYMIEGDTCVDRFLRYERIQQDVDDLCGDLGISSEPLGWFKTGVRGSAMPVAAYYTRRVAQRVAATFAWEIERFSYALSATPQT